MTNLWVIDFRVSGRRSLIGWPQKMLEQIFDNIRFFCASVLLCFYNSFLGILRKHFYVVAELESKMVLGGGANNPHNAVFLV